MTFIENNTNDDQPEFLILVHLYIFLLDMTRNKPFSYLYKSIFLRNYHL